MQDYRRKIAYLYAYEGGEKLGNAGFVKAEDRGGICRLAVHLRCYSRSGEDPGKVYLYFRHRQQLVGIYLGALKNRNGALEWQGTFSSDDIQGKGIRFGQTEGIWIQRPGGKEYVAEWDDYPVDISRFVIYPKGGEKCIRCPWFGKCERSSVDEADRRGTVYEVPIGCVIVRDGKIIARGYNRRNTDLNTLAHAELQAIRKASRVVGDWRLEDCVMYITLEPCQMCAGAIVQARIPKVVIGSRNPKAGCAGSVLDLLHVPAFNHQVELEEGVLKEECSELLVSFFRELRQKKKANELTNR